MEAKPKRYRSLGWASVLYLFAAAAWLWLTVSAGMDEARGSGGFSPFTQLSIFGLGTVAGAVGAILLLVRARRTNANYPIAIEAAAFGAVIFALGLLASVYVLQPQAKIGRP